MVKHVCFQSSCILHNVLTAPPAFNPLRSFNPVEYSRREMRQDARRGVSDVFALIYTELL